MDGRDRNARDLEKVERETRRLIDAIAIEECPGIADEGPR